MDAGGVWMEPHIHNRLMGVVPLLHKLTEPENDPWKTIFLYNPVVWASMWSESQGVIYYFSPTCRSLAIGIHLLFPPRCRTRSLRTKDPFGRKTLPSEHDLHLFSRVFFVLELSSH